MAHHTPTTRRDFLSTTAKLAGVAGLAAATGTTYAAGRSQQEFEIKKGPAPKTFGPNDKIRVGLIGIGSRGQQILEPALNPELNLQFVAIADPHDRHRNQAAQKIKEALNQEPELYSGRDDWKRLLERDDVDAVQLATPPNLHAMMYLGCFAAGKHFYGEKPMCIARDEADALLAAQEKNPDVIAQIGFQRRGTAQYQEGIKRIHDGVIGSPIDGRGAWNNSWGPLGLPEQGTRVWFGRREQSGDWMLEQACHTWDVMNWVAGKLPISAYGMGEKGLFHDLDPDRDVTDYYITDIEYPDHFYVNFSHSWICPKNDENRFFGIYERIAGMKGGICLDEGKIYWRDEKKKPEQLPGESGWPHMTNQNVPRFYHALRTNTKPVAGVIEGRNATLVGLMVRKAVDERRKVTMEEILTS